MNYKEFFIQLISKFISGGITREEVAHEVAMEFSIDNAYDDNIELMENCEWALRHINEQDYWTTENELQYYLSCLKGDESFSVEARDRMLK